MMKNERRVQTNYVNQKSETGYKVWGRVKKGVEGKKCTVALRDALSKEMLGNG